MELCCFLSCVGFNPVLCADSAGFIKAELRRQKANLSSKEGVSVKTFFPSVADAFRTSRSRKNTLSVALIWVELHSTPARKR